MWCLIIYTVIKTVKVVKVHVAKKIGENLEMRKFSYTRVNINNVIKCYTLANGYNFLKQNIWKFKFAICSTHKNIQNVLTDRKRVPRIYCSVLSLVSVEIIIRNHFGPLLREGRCTFGSVITLLVC